MQARIQIPQKTNTLKRTYIEQATCIKQACIQFLQKANTLKSICIKQAHFDYPLCACLI